jgi:hypothetical protein
MFVIMPQSNGRFQDHILMPQQALLPTREARSKDSTKALGESHISCIPLAGSFRGILARELLD